MKRAAMKHTCRLAAAVVAACIGAARATPNVPPPPQSHPILVTGATLHTVSGANIANGRMLIDKGRIVAIGDAASLAALPPNTQVIALDGKHVYPGLISANTSMGLIEVQAVRATDDTTEVGVINPNVRALVGVNADSEIIPVTRTNGILAALTVPGVRNDGIIAGTSALIQMDGWNWEEMSLIPEAGLRVVLPAMRHNAALFPNLPPTVLDLMQKNTQQRLKTLETAFETAAAYVKARAADPAQPIDARWEAMRAVLAGTRPVFIDAEDIAQIRYALGFTQRFHLKLVIVGGQDAWRVAELLREREVPVVIDGVNRLPLRRGDDIDAPFRLAARLSAAGVRYCIARGSSTFEADTERNLPYEAAAAAAYGLPRDEALKAITLYPAQILGAADSLGSLEAGKLASFFVTNGDPLEIATQVERIFIQGRDVPLGDRHTALQKKYEQKYQQLKSR
ncbi:MAG: amidohydrolase family protein [Betaproteobacteria bacterium]|nr:amidohydrolase family protein [Betaproteobacteria bacterium]